MAVLDGGQDVEDIGKEREVLGLGLLLDAPEEGSKGFHGGKADGDSIILKAPVESLENGGLMLFLYDARCRRKHSISRLTLPCVGCHAEIEEHGEDFGPLLTC